jgi:hypothetical protein
MASPVARKEAPMARVLFFIALMAGSLVLPGCGDHDKPDTRDYFLQFEQIMHPGERRPDILAEAVWGGGKDRDAAREYFASVQVTHRQLLQNLQDLQPPPEAQDAHGEYLAAYAEIMTVFDDFADSFASSSSPPGLELVSTRPSGPAWEAAAQRFENACLRLQGIAMENGIEIDLDCD